ncbi:MAG: hypothetical protein IT285_07175 [Bdellovibrionales bacterium]|nr:hypothetical protein [Bdellovibrionales bacterium]
MKTTHSLTLTLALLTSLSAQARADENRVAGIELQAAHEGQADDAGDLEAFALRADLDGFGIRRNSAWASRMGIGTRTTEGGTEVSSARLKGLFQMPDPGSSSHGFDFRLEPTYTRLTGQVGAFPMSTGDTANDAFGYFDGLSVGALWVRGGKADSVPAFAFGSGARVEVPLSETLSWGAEASIHLLLGEESGIHGESTSYLRAEINDHLFAKAIVSADFTAGDFPIENSLTTRIGGSVGTAF